MYFITNSLDKGTSQYKDINHLYRIKSFGSFSFLGSIIGIIGETKNIESIIRSNKEPDEKNAIIVTAGSYLSDVLAAFITCNRLNMRAVIHLHHLSPPPWLYPLRRGGLIRSTAKWILLQLALALVKIGGMLPCIDQPVEIFDSGWKFGVGVLNDDAFLTQDAEDIVCAPSKRYDACFIGRISQPKGVCDLLRAWKIVTRHLPNAKLVMAGRLYSSRLAKKLFRYVDKFKLEKNVVFLPRHVDEAEKRSILLESKLFVFPSYEEGWSLSVMEAVSQGVLPVTYDIHAYDYLGPNAVKVPLGDWRGLAIAVTNLIQNEEERISLTMDLKNRITKFKLKDIAKGQLLRYMEFVENGRIYYSKPRK